MSPDSLFQTAFDNASIGMALVSPDGKWLSVNRSLCELLGYSEVELYEKTFQELTHPDDLHTDLGYVEDMLAGRIARYEMEKRYFHKTDRVVTVLLSVSLVRDYDGRPRFFISQIQDITARKKGELELNEALAEKSRLLGELSASTATIQTLQKGLLTICAWTKQVQHDGRWMSTEEFLTQHLRFNVSHGISEAAKDKILESMRGTLPE